LMTYIFLPHLSLPQMNFSFISPSFSSSTISSIVPSLLPFSIFPTSLPLFLLFHIQDSMSRQHRSRERLRDGAMITATICCLPCLCLVGSYILLSHAFHKLISYERPSTRRKRACMWKEREIRRRTPRVLAPRTLGSTLTIGREDDGAMSGLGSKIIELDDSGSRSGSSSSGEEVVRSPGRIERRTDWQSQSPFFALPPEIRRLIYEEAIGGYTFHIFTQDAYRRMAHTRCKTRYPGECGCRSQTRQPGVPDEWGNISLLSLLTTSRRMCAPPPTFPPSFFLPPISTLHYPDQN